MSRLLCLFVLFFIHPAELRPTTTIIDDLPTEEVIDYLIKYGYLRGASLLKWHHFKSSMTKTNGSSQEHINRSVNKSDDKRNGVNIVNVKNKIENIFGKTEIEAAIVTLQSFLKLPATGKIDQRTLNLMKSTRCGDADITPGNEVASEKKVTPRIQMDNHLPPLKRHGETTVRWGFVGGKKEGFYKEHIEYAMNMWAAVSEVNFKYIPNEDDPVDILLAFKRSRHQDGKPFDGKGGELAHYIVSNPFEIHFDADEDWQVQWTKDWSYGHPYVRPKCKPYVKGSQCAPDFVQMTMHQIGHYFGFPHSDNKKSIMYSVLQPGKEGDLYKLHTTDMHKVKSLRGHCHPKRVDAAFSNTEDGRTYMIVGPYTYKFDNRKLAIDQSYATVAQTWPRLSKNIWKSFPYIDEIFIHMDGNRYYFSGDKYAVHLKNEGDIGGVTWSGNLGHGVDEKTNKTYVGWYGLAHHKYINGALRIYDKATYIFQDEYVYKWDKHKRNKYNDDYHWPHGSVADGGKRLISDEFPGLPRNKKIDSVFQYYYDSRIYFFIGEHFYVFNTTTRKAKRAKMIKELFRNICNVYMCTEDNKCKTWDSTKETCGTQCDR